MGLFRWEVGLRADMFMERLRRQMKWIIIAVAVAFAVTLAYVGIPAVQGDRGAEAAIAHVNGDAIAMATFQQAYLDQLRSYEQAQGSVRPTDIEEIKYRTLNQLIAMRLLLQAARDEGIRVGRGEVNDRLSRIRDAFPSRSEYERQLRLRNMTEADLRKAIEEGLMAEKLQAKLAEQLQVTDEEVARAYEQVKLRQILVRPASTAEADTRAALARARELVRRIRGGADFAEVAKEQSDDELTRESGGDLGFVGHDVLPEPVEAVAWDLEPGAVSDPIETDEGYYVIQVVERKAAAGEEFEKAKPDLLEQIRQEKADEHFARWFADLRNSAEVSILDPQLAARDALARGDAERALELYDQAALVYPDDAYVQYGKAVALLQLQRVDDALAALSRATELAPSDPVLHLALGNVYQQKGDKEKAAEALRKASSLAPMDMQMHLTLYMLFSSMGLDEDARREEQELEKIQQVLEEQRRAQEEFLRRLQEQQQGSQSGGASDDAASADASSQPEASSGGATQDAAAPQQR